MKRAFLNKLIAVAVISTTLITMAPMRVSAAWMKDNQNNWKYSEWYGPVVGWKQINGLWYYFNSDGIMQTGVVQVAGKIYLLSESGVMQTGEAVINGVLYKFDSSGAIIGTDVLAPTKGFDAMGNSTVPYTPNQVINQYDDNSSPTNPNSSSLSSDKAEKYTVTYKDDDGEKLKSKTVEKDEKIELYEPEKDGYTFVEWNTKKNGNGTSYDEGDKIKVTEDTTLYAQWEEDDESDNSDSTDEKVLVNEIIVGTKDDVNTITTKSGTLQLEAKVLPIDAGNKKVTWSILSGTGQATISEDGLLTSVADGKITVKATSKDGSNVNGTKTITITGQSSSGGTENPDPEKLLNITKVTYNTDANTIDVTFDKAVAGELANGTTAASGALLPSNYTISGTAGLTGNPESVQIDATKKIVTLKLSDVLKGTAKQGGTIIVTVANIIGTSEEVLKTASGQYTVPASNAATLESLGYEFLGENSSDIINNKDNILSNDKISFDQEVNQSIKVKIKATVVADNNSATQPTISYKVGSGSYKTLTTKEVTSPEESPTKEVTLPEELPKKLTGEAFIDLIDKGETIVNVRVTAADGKTNKIYTINFNRTKSNKKDITSFKFKNTSPIIIGAIDESNKIKTISAVVDNGANMDLVAEYSVSPGASVTVGGVEQVSGETQNTFVNKDKKVYTVVAEDGSEKKYEVTVTQKDLETIKQIIINGLNAPVAGEKPTNIVMEYGTYTAKVKWISNIDNVETVMAEGETFKPNTKYVAQVEVSAKSGYNFDSYYQPNLQNYTDSGILVNNGIVVDKDGANKAIQPSDADRKNIEFNVNYDKTGIQQLKQPSVILSDAGVATWSNLDDKASKYSVQLYKNNSKVGGSILLTTTSAAATMEYNLLQTMRSNGVGSYTVGVTAIGDEINYTKSKEGVSLNQKIRQLPVVSVLQWDGNIARFNKLTDTNVDKYIIKLYKDNLEIGTAQEISANALAEKDFSTEILAHGNGRYKFDITAISKGGLFIDSNITYSKELVKTQL